MKPNYRTVVLDVDSTLSAIEGIDWLAARRGPEEARRVATLTDQAMTGEIPLENVYAERLTIVKPNRDDVAALSDAYVANVAPDAHDVIQSWLAAGVKVVIISGGIRSALSGLAAYLGVPDSDVHAVAIMHDDKGFFTSHQASPLSVATGKREILQGLDLPRPMLAVGDGSTDLEMKQVADAFAAYTGFVTRGNVTARADYVVATFTELKALVAA